ncbi:MAG: hydrolase [Chloroflexota bacterium]|nr:MAG: hydrolase [Chloroflexota bacterium]
MPIRLLALDLDGTILADLHTISPRTQAAIKGAIERGVYVSIATGREYDITHKFVEMLGLTTPTICCQGGLIFNGHTGETINHDGLSVPLAHQLIDLARARRLALHLCLGGSGTYTEFATPFSRQILEEVGGVVVEVSDLKQVVTVPPTKGLIVHPADEAGALVTELQATLNGNLSVFRSHTMLIEVTSPTVSKGHALAFLADYYGIPQSEVMAIGDQDNDVEMIAWAGLGVAMGNASAGAKAAADVIAPPLSEEGAAWAIEKYILQGNRVAEG